MSVTQQMGDFNSLLERTGYPPPNEGMYRLFPAATGDHAGWKRAETACAALKRD